MIILKSHKPEISYSPNLEFNCEYDENHYLDRLYIYWDITTKCNFKCSYCYARPQYKNISDNIHLSEKFLVIDAISKTTHPVFLGLMGGEPTIDENFIKIVENCQHKILNKNKNSRLYITTNGFSKKIINVPFSNQIYFLISIHLEHKKQYTLRNDFDIILNNILYLQNKGFKVKVNILLLPDKKYWNDIDFLVQWCIKNNVLYHPHFIYTSINHKDVLYNYDDEFYNHFKELTKTKYKYIFETDNFHVKVSDYEIFKYKLNNFNGWKCYNNNFEIKISNNGYILHRLCDEKTILLKNNFNYFKNFKIKPMICKYDTCNSDGVLKCLKVRKTN